MGGVVVAKGVQTIWILITARVVVAGIACLSNPCLHGICIDDINSTYSCYCVDGYTGVLCQTNWDECWSNPCENGGTCIDGIASYNCSCPEGFIGDNCETNFNECESNPCQNNGTCIDLSNGYVCSCIPGFSGDHCEIDFAVCNSSEEVRCYNGGHCIEGPGLKFYCRCLTGWSGSKCEDPVDECESNPCQNDGICIDAHADYMCACTFGYTGKNCEVQIEFCDSKSCSNNAICVVEGGQRVCYCVPDYHGDRCEEQYDECLLGTGCMNGGTCIDGVDNFTCSCPPKLTGLLCECLILDDGSYDCEYVSPTPITTTQAVLLTTIRDTGTTSEIVSISSEFYNDTITKSTSTETWTSSVNEISTTEKETDLTTEVITVTEFITTLTPTDLSSRKTDVATVKFEIPLTTEAQAVKTTEITTITTDCGESCIQTLTTNISIPVQEMTTTINENTETTDNYVITTGEVTTISIDLPITTESTDKEKQTTVTIDVATEKLFTESPTEHTLTDTTTTTVITSSPTTESLEISTAFDNVTVFPPDQSECSDFVCNNHGICINTPNGIRCHCAFNYDGRFCNEKISIITAAFSGNSYIAHRLLNSTSIYVEFNAKTLITDGQIMYVDISKGIYMQLFMNMGLLKFKFSCGHQTMLLSELKTYVNKGYSMKIETRLDLDIQNQHCNATLRLNDTVAMSGGQVANISLLDYNTTLYLGNSPNVKDPESKPFIGCIKDLVVNEEKRLVFGDSVEAGEITECSSLSCLSGPCLNGGSCSDHGDSYICSCANGWMGVHCERSICEHNPCQFGGSCVRHPGSGFLCLCPYGKHGIFCEYNVEIQKPSMAPLSPGTSSFLMYPMSTLAMNSERFDLRLRFQTNDMEQIALLAFIGQVGRHDSRTQHLAVTFVKGYVMLSWNMGSGVESFGPWGPEAPEYYKELSSRLIDASGDSRAGAYLGQRFSLAIQRVNAASILGPRRIFTPRPLSDRRGGHTVRVGRRGRTAWLSVDSRFNISGNAAGSEVKMVVFPQIYIGGHPSQNFQDLPHDLPLHSGWSGCIWDIGGSAVGSGKPAGGRGIGQCGVAQCSSKSCSAPNGICIHTPATYGCICNEGWFGPTCSSKQNPCDSLSTKCKGRCVISSAAEPFCDCPYGKTGTYCDQELIPTDVLLPGVRSYIRLRARRISSVSLSLEAELRPARARGLILFAETPHFYTALSMQGGVLEYRWTDRVSGVTSLVRSGAVSSMSSWHEVRAGRYGSRLYVWADGELNTDAMAAHAHPHTAANVSVLLGGSQDLSSLPYDVMSGPPEYFTGCIRNLHINNVFIPLEKENIEESQNLSDCDGTPCGEELCGGTCTIEAGVAKCSCSGGRGRCRRRAALRDLCRDRQPCPCAADNGDDICDEGINITIPQFSGNSLLSLSRKATADRHIEEQHIGMPSKKPSYVSFNFTTAEDNGLLFWCSMDTDYLGIGLENGFLKLVWSFRRENTEETLEETETKVLETSRILSKRLPHVGFLADAEWHFVILRLEKAIISLLVDQIVAYVEEPGLNGPTQYDVVDIFVGGVSEKQSSTAKRAFPHNFKGCIDNIWTSEEPPSSLNYTELYSENIRSCQLFP